MTGKHVGHMKIVGKHKMLENYSWSPVYPWNGIVMCRQNEQCSEECIPE